MRSATIIFGEKIRPILAMFSIVSCSLVAYAGICNGHGYPFFVGVTLGAAQLARHLATIDFENGESCDASLFTCSWFGFWIWAGATADYAMKTQF
jgi:4-hydroxybenzoate polyprenyltransferase